MVCTIPNGAGRLRLSLSLLRKGQPADVRTAASPSGLRDENLSSSLVRHESARAEIEDSDPVGRNLSSSCSGDFTSPSCFPPNLLNRYACVTQRRGIDFSLRAARMAAPGKES